MTLPEVMKSRRKTLSLSQQDLAEMAGIGLSTIKDIERGQGNPSLATISKILVILGMEMVFQVRQTVWSLCLWDNWLFIWITEKLECWQSSAPAKAIVSITMRPIWHQIIHRYPWHYPRNKNPMSLLRSSLFSWICCRKGQTGRLYAGHPELTKVISLDYLPPWPGKISLVGYILKGFPND